MKFKALFLLLILPFLVAFLYIYFNSRPVSNNTSTKIFEIKKGDGVSSISNNLIKNNLIRDKYTFFFYTHSMGLNNKLQFGNYKLSSSMTTQEIITKLSEGGVTDYWLKIIDGTRVEEVSGLPLTKTKNLEGYLFPDSYLIPQYFNTDQILATIKTNFDKKFAQAKQNQTNKMNDSQIIILASIIEREARTLGVKQGVAGVLINRININMPLQSDTTIQYIRDSLKKPTKYWQDINASDISIISPFNTYKNKGLPPSPICNPGYDSIYAAFHPTESDYIFYLTGNDGVMYYAKTLDQHNVNIDKYLR